MKKNMSIKIIGAVCLWAAIGLTACKAPQLSPDGNVRIAGGDGHTYDTAFVKAVGMEWCFYRIPSCRDMWRSL